jgi:hypothetical protein
MRFTTHVAAIRIIAAAVFIAVAGLLVQSFAEGEHESTPSTAKAMAAAGGAGLPGLLPTPVKVKTVKVPAPDTGPVTHTVPDGGDPRWGKPVHAAPAFASPAEAELPAEATLLASLRESGETIESISMATASTSAGEQAGLTAGDDVEIDIEVVVAAAKDFTVEKAPAKTTRINTDARLRARGSNAAQIIGVIPRGSQVAVIRCDSWCEVSYDGKRGFVYSGFVSGYQRQRSAASRPAPAAGKEPAKAVAEAKAQAQAQTQVGLASRLFGDPEKVPETGTD